MKYNIDPQLINIRTAFENANTPIRLVGGCVRDLLLGVTPKDWDMTTPATPKNIIKILSAANIECFDMSNGHGTITAVINGEPYEITTLREDTETDGRHAVVKFTDDWEVDAGRRDFTFNALSMDWDGNIYDYFGGVEDLKNNRVRFVGDATTRIQEDYLRIMRYFRFLGRMPFPIADIDTITAITTNRDGLKDISGERIWSEMSKILSGENVKFILDLIDAAKVSGAIEFKTDGGWPPASKDPITNLAAFIDSEFVEIVQSRWKLSNADSQKLVFLVNFRDSYQPVWQLKEDLFNGTPREYILEVLKIQKRQDDFDTMKVWEIPVMPVRGADLIAMGMKPSPLVGTTMKILKALFVSSNYQASKEELLANVTIDESPE